MSTNATVIAPDGTEYFGHSVGTVLDCNRGHYLAADTITEYASFATPEELALAEHYPDCDDPIEHACGCEWIYEIADAVIERFNEAARAQGAPAILGYWEGSLMLWNESEWEESDY